MARTEVQFGTDLLADEVSAGMALSQEAGWNQIPPDWDFFQRHGRVFTARTDGQVVATSAVVFFENAAWVGLVLVAKAWRRRGLATQLVNSCIAEAEARAAEIWLDATPDGAEVYSRLNFVRVGELVRMRRPSLGGVPCASKLAEGADLNAFIKLDWAAFGFDRAMLMRNFVQRQGTVLRRVAEDGCLVRDGRVARHIGPLMASSEDGACKLIAAALEGEPGELIIDLYRHHAQTFQFLLNHGFAEERKFFRMVRGKDAVPSASPSAFASAGPEYG